MAMSAEERFVRVAAIDIGTVTTRLLIADVFVQDTARVLIEEVCRDLRITHLGRGIDASGQLSHEGMRAVFEALSEYDHLIKHFQVDDVLCVATSAVRDASNAEQLSAAAAKLGLEIEIIPGQIEAQLSFMGAIYDGAESSKQSSNLNSNLNLVVDIGGGSTELVLGRLDAQGRAEIIKLDSLQVGSRRLTDMFIDSDPPHKVELKMLRNYLQKLCSFDLRKYVGEFDCLTATAGTATTLAAVMGKIDPYSPKEIQGYKVSRADLDELLQLFVSKKLEQRQKIRGLDPRRADVIVAGTLIMEGIMDALDCKEFFASDRDLLYGIILSATKSALSRRAS